MNILRFSIFFCLLFAAGKSYATHEVDHRYTIYGQVSYEDGSAATGIPVLLMGANDTVLTEIETDNFGRFKIVLHVHNEDLGRNFDIVAADQRRKASIEFDPNDATTEREQHFDFTIKSP